MCQKDAHELIDMATDFMNRRPQLSRGGHFEILEHDALAAFSITGLPAATGMMFLIRGSIARGVAGSASKSADAA
ncbi:hypothetical protein JCM18916_3643 [Cutibacterium acnes JCM 18916]|nr:hypothetical protein JCM18916_3643 [Cutibacterium acnes JCM 18916]